MSVVPQVPFSVALRVDASVTIGTGHLRRCLSLAEALVEQGAAVILVVRRLDAVAPHLLRDCNFPVRWLPAPGPDDAPDADGPPHAAWAGVGWQRDADETAAALCGDAPQWLVIDHYSFNARWHDTLREALGSRLLVIDDLADRALSPDILIDHNWAESHRAKYRDRLTREPRRWLTGPRFALLSAAYRDAHRYRFHPEVRSIGIFMGGTDPGGASVRVLHCVRAGVGFQGPVEVVSTLANPHLAALRQACEASPGTTLTLDLPDLAAFFARHDLQIGAGGGATWERCCIGAPTLGLALSANQVATIHGLNTLGAIQASELAWPVAAISSGVREHLSHVLRQAIAQPEVRENLARSAMKLVDGRGADRVALGLIGQNLCLRRARVADAEMLLRWRNHPAVRSMAIDTEVIELSDHLRWMQRVLDATDRWLFIAEVGALPVGSIRFDLTASDRAMVSLYTDPMLRGLGLGQQMLRRGECALSRAVGRAITVHATVAPGNAASARLFAAGGYTGGPTEFRKPLRTAIQDLKCSS